MSIGVNLGLLPTKGLTLPLISAGGSSVMMTCVAIGLLLRVSYELDRAQRQVARLRGEGARAPGGEGPPPPPTTQPPPSAVAGVRGTSRLRPRIEPTLGGLGRTRDPPCSPRDLTRGIARSFSRVHFVGVGGASMSIAGAVHARLQGLGFGHRRQRHHRRLADWA